jgi:hypothetical protein
LLRFAAVLASDRGVAEDVVQEVRAGDPMSASLGYWGSNIARGGFLAESADGLPGAARDYVDRLVPYFACAAEWYETVGIGVTRYPGLWQRVATHRRFMAEVLGTGSGPRRCRCQTWPATCRRSGYLAPGHAARLSGLGAVRVSRSASAPRRTSLPR